MSEIIDSEYVNGDSQTQFAECNEKCLSLTASTGECFSEKGTKITPPKLTFKSLKSLKFHYGTLFWTGGILNHCDFIDFV